MEARKQCDRFGGLAWTKRVATCGIALLLLLAAWPAVAQQAPGVNPGKVRRQKALAPAPVSSQENALQAPLPDAPSAAQRNLITLSSPPPEDRLNPDDPSPAKDSPVSAWSSTAVATSAGGSAQPESLPLKWQENHEEGCTRAGGLKRAQSFIAQNLWVAAVPDNGGTMVFYLKIPEHLPGAAAACDPAQQR